MNLTRITTGWTIVRIIRLLFAIFIAVQAVELREPLLGLFAAFFLYQALANVACCGVTCVVSPSKPAKTSVSETTYEEIKS
ncbi:MAG: hypothetical protein ACKOWL_07710 [Sphingobacteriaceae bacterium]